MKKIIFSLLALAFLACQNNPKENAPKDLNDFDFLEITIPELQAGYAAGNFTITDVIKAYSERINAIDHNGPSLMSVIVINPDAGAIADSLDQVALENRGPLHGVPVLLKDNIDTRDKMATTAGSRALAGSMPLEDSFVAAQLRAAGAVILGKANLSEWANFRGEMSSSGWSGCEWSNQKPLCTDQKPLWF